MLRPALLLLALAAACGPGDRDGSAPDADTGIDATVPHPDGTPAQCYDTVTEVEVALQIQIQQSCAIWNSLAELSGRATVTRTATTLTIDFGNGVVFCRNPRERRGQPRLLAQPHVHRRLRLEGDRDARRHAQSVELQFLAELRLRRICRDQ